MNEQQIRDALRGVAEAGGQPGTDAAWEDVCRGIAADRTSRSRRLVLGGAVVAIAAAAAAFALLADPTDDEAVQVGPSGQTTVTTECRPDEVVVSDRRIPDHPMAVVVQDGDGQRLDLYDADTCGLLQPDLAHSSGRITNVSIEGASLTYTEEVGDTTQVRLMTYDRNRVPFTLTQYFEGVTDVRSLVGSDGTLAWVEPGETQSRDRIALWHTPTNATRYLEWAPGEQDQSLTDGRIDDIAFSPDGTWLAFVSSYDGRDDIRVINVTASSLSESRSLGVAATDPAWTDLEGILAVEGDGSLIRINVEAVDPTTLFPAEDDAVNIAVIGGILAVVSADGSLSVGDQDAGALRPFEIDGTVVDVGL